MSTTPGRTGRKRTPWAVRGENSVKVLDLQVGAVEEVRVGPEPDTMQLTNDGRTLVVALRGTPAYVALVDTNDYTGARWTQLDGTTTGHQWLSTDGAQTFVAVEEPGLASGLSTTRPARRWPATATQ